MNDSLNMDQINTLDTRKKHAYGDLELKYVYQFFIWSKKWQFLSGYFFFSGAKYPDALQEHPDMTLFTTFILNTGNPYCFDTGMALLIPNFFSVIKKLT